MYFSVKRAIKINGKAYVPCVCYEITRDIEAVVNDLVKKNRAVKYDKYVGFCNGKSVIITESAKRKSSK